MYDQTERRPKEKYKEIECIGVTLYVLQLIREVKYFDSAWRTSIFTRESPDQQD